MKDQGEWLKQMAELQQQYWDGWREATGQAMDQSRPAAAPWQDGLDAWSRALGGVGAANPFAAGKAAVNPFAVPGFANAMPAGFGQADMGERMLAHGKQYLELLQGLMSGGGFQGGGQFDPRGWIEEMRGLQERYGKNLLGGVGALPWFGGLDPAQVEQMVKSFTAAPMRGIQQDVQGWLGVPAFGLGREHQERAQALLSAWLDHQNANARYNELMLKSSARALELLQGKLAEREQPGRQIESARALYDLWIDAAEEAFAEAAMSADYRSVYGELVNTQMRVRAGLNTEIERFGAQFGLPTRTEVDSLARQVHELKRELRRRQGGVSAQTKSASAAASSRPAAAAAKATGPAPAVAESAIAAAAVRSATAKPAKPGKGKSGAPGASGKPLIQSTARKTAKGS